MRVLFVPLAPTHYFHMVPLAWAFRAAGHEVRVAAQPPVEAAIHASGLTAVRLDDRYEFMSGAMAAMRRIEAEVGPLPADFDTDESDHGMPPDVVRWVRLQQIEVLVETAESMADDLVEFARWWRPSLVVTDPLAFASPLAAAVTDAPLARHLWGPGVPGAGIPTEYWPVRLHELYARFGVAPNADPAACNIDPCPPSLQIPDVPNQLRHQFVAYNGPGVQPEWLTRPADRPRVCITMGSVVTELRGSNKFLSPEFLTALASLDIDVVAALGKADRDLVGEPPAGVRLVSLPLHLLLPSCDAIIHHGGASTALTAAAAGLPQIVAGAEPDDHLLARSLAEVGAGVSLRPENTGAAEFRDAVAAIIADPAAKKAAAGLRSEILRQPLPADIVPTLEKLV